ncbi:MAG: hypothetical protein HQK65_13695 [Desulfamplus sp.]|nr:hypothetical protein [Desulfamplus sp.]
MLKELGEIYEQIFPFSDPKNENSRIFKREKLTDKHVSFLLACPGLLAVEIARITGKKGVKEQVDKLYSIIKKNKNVDPINLDRELITLIQPIMLRLYLLVLPQSIPLDSDFIESLFFSVSKYYLLICFLIRNLVARENSISLAPENIVDMINKYSGDDLMERQIQLLGLYWTGLAQAMAMRKVFDYSKKIEKSHLKAASIPIGSTYLLMDQMCTKNGNEFGYIKHKDDVKNKSNLLGFALNISRLDKVDIPFDIWMMELNEDYPNLSDETHHYGYLFENKLSENSDTVQNLIYSIFNCLQKTLKISDELIEKWDSFIEATDEYLEDIEENQETKDMFDQWQNGIINSRNLLEAFKNSTPLFNAITSLPFKLPSDEITIRMTRFRKALKKHIPTGNDEQLINDINKAHKEVRIFVKIIRDINKQESILKIQDKWKNELKGSKFLKEICALTYDEEIKAFFSEIKQNFKYLKNVENKHLETKSILNSNLNTAIKSVSRSIMPDILKASTGFAYDVSGDVVLRFAGITKDYKLTKTTSKKKHTNVSDEKFIQVHNKNTT